jgi:hypothetical protein
MNERREARVPIAVVANVEVNNNGQIVHATTINVSGCGVLLRFDEAIHVSPGDEVLCEFSSASPTQKSLPCWVFGSVVRVEGNRVAIDFRSGSYYAQETERESPLKKT